MFASVWKLMQEKHFEFDNEISSELICSICKCLMIKACSAPCGCRFCFNCIEHYLDGNDKFCPGAGRRCEGQTINFADDIVIDNQVNSRIVGILVKCPMPNCQFKDRLEGMESHMETCGKRPISCPFNAIGCKINEVVNDEMKGHLYEGIYIHNNFLIDLIDNLRNEIESLNHEIIELRENKENQQQFDKIELQLIRQQQKMCEMEMKLTDNKKEIDELRNEKDQLKQQLDNMNDKICVMEMKLIDNIGEIDELNEEMVAVKDENRSLRKEIETNIGSINQIRQQIEVTETKCQQQIDKVKEKCEQKLQQWNEKAQIGIEKCPNEIWMIETKLGNIKCINYAFFEWQIDKLLQQKRDNLICRKAFYSGPIGYKMCLAVFIWDIVGTIGVGFCLMCGENDDQLDWPFQYSVTVDVINPENGNICLSKSVKYSERPDHAGWRKPSNDRNDLICIYSDIPINSNATKNGKLLLRCKIDK